MSGQHLRTEGRLLIDAEATVESAQLVVLIDKSAIGGQKTEKRIFLPEVAFHA